MGGLKMKAKEMAWFTAGALVSCLFTASISSYSCEIDKFLIKQKNQDLEYNIEVLKQQLQDEKDAGEEALNLLKSMGGA